MGLAAGLSGVNVTVVVCFDLQAIKKIKKQAAIA